MEVLAKPWNGLIMATLAAGTLRFSELSQRLQAMGDRMLSARLKELEARGLVERRVSPGPPVRVDYALTEVGRGFGDVVAALGNWGGRFLDPPVGPRASRPGLRPRAKKVRAWRRAVPQ
jgi:DNA-binding HxlR family transcriptional regulator